MIQGLLFIIFFSYRMLLLTPTSSPPLPIPEYIAHAGGGVGELMYTNSLEALNNSYQKGIRYFEIDLEKTSDGQLVLLHDWDYCMGRFFQTQPQIYSLEEYKKLKMINGLTQISFQEFIEWLADKPDVMIIPDNKRNVLNNLFLVATKYPELKNRVVPQIYKFRQYLPVLLMGYDRVVLTLYASDYTPKQLIHFISTHRLWAVTISTDRIARTKLSEIIAGLGTPVLAHPVNSLKQAEELRQRAVSGFYTAFLPLK